jgi:hypothetical protein
VVKQGEHFFKFQRGGGQLQQEKKLYAMLDRGTRKYPLWQAQRFRGIGIISRGLSYHQDNLVNDGVGVASGLRGDRGKCGEWGESYEWHLVQSCDRRYRSCQSALDYVSGMFDRHGYKLDLLDHQKILRDFLRSLDPTFVHDYERTLERCSARYFAWFFVGVSLCTNCYSMLHRRQERCAGCNMVRHQQMRKNLTYSQILAIPNKQGAVEPTKTRMKTLPVSPRSPVAMREQRPMSLSDIQTDVLPFLLHAHFWTTAPKRYLNSRRIETRKNIWDRSARETLKWSKLLREKHGITTVSILALWSVRRLKLVGHVPARTARTIGLMLEMLQREMEKWSTTNGQSVLLSRNANEGGVEELE